MKTNTISGFLPKTIKSGLATASALLLFAGSSHAALTLVGSYDPAIPPSANVADQSATFGSGTGSITSANVLTLATFQGLVSTAFTNGNGGVIDFEGAGDSIGAGDVFTTSAFGGRTLSFTDTADAGRNLTINDFSGGSGSRLPISGINALGNQQSINFNSFSLTGGDPADRLTHFGMTVLQRNQDVNFTVIATFSDSSTLTFNQVSMEDSDNIGVAVNSEDTFFGFVAPDNESITNIAFSTSQFTAFDDIGFIVTPVPEPSSTALLALAGLALILRRRRS